MDPTLLKKNLDALEAMKIPPVLPQDFKEKVKDPAWSPVENDIELEYQKPRRGSGTLRLIQGDVKTSLFNPFEPFKHPTEMLTELTREPEDTLVLVGLGLGHTAQCALQLYGEDVNLCVLEPSVNAFRLAMQNEDLTDILHHPRLYLGVGPEETDAYFLIRCAWDARSSVHLHQLHEPYTKLPVFECTVASIQKAIDNSVLMSQLNFNTGRTAGQVMHRNMMLNMPLALTSASSYDLTVGTPFKGKPMVVVVPGPSLKKNVHLLKDLEDRVLIVALDTSIKPLQKVGIKPHIVATIDPNEINAQKFPDEGLPDDVALFACLEGCHTVWKKAPPIRFAYARDPAQVALMARHIGTVMQSPTSGSVVSDALILGYTLECHPIITIGFDLAFTDDEWYAPGAFRTDPKDRHPGSLQVDAIGGGKVETCVAYYSTLIWLDSYLKRLTGDTLYLDATEGGALKKHLTPITFAEAIEQHVGDPFGPRAAVKKCYDDAMARKRKNPPTSTVHDIVDAMKDIQEKAGKLKTIYESMIDALDRRENAAFLELAEESTTAFEEILDMLSENNYLDASLYAPLVELCGVDTEGLESGSVDKHKAYLNASLDFWKKMLEMSTEETEFLEGSIADAFDEARAAFLGSNDD